MDMTVSKHNMSPDNRYKWIVNTYLNGYIQEANSLSVVLLVYQSLSSTNIASNSGYCF